SGLPYVVRVSGPDIPGFERRYGAIYPMLTPVIRSVWRAAAVVVAKCADEAELIAKTDSKIGVTLIPNGVDLAAFPQTMISTNGPLRLLCVARLIERKGQHHLIAAVRRLVDIGIDVTLDLVGTGDAQATCEALAQELDIAERVRFCGYIPREQIAERYAQADVFVLPSFNEGMSVATLEAMAAGLPTVVTRTGGTAELVADQVSGLIFDWGDVKAMAGHIARLARDRALAQRMGAAAHERATHFSWEATMQRYLEIFHELAAQRTMPKSKISTAAARK
ncbi:MAG: glycosyltransferase family 4 protein, partial [Roseiflexaceae bacterium]|nr:glycosyltransferase family 4 protein [Roseiflexaceae bacterium]